MAAIGAALLCGVRLDGVRARRELGLPAAWPADRVGAPLRFGGRHRLYRRGRCLGFDDTFATDPEC